MQAEIADTVEENYYNIDYVIDVINKEAPNDKRLAKQVVYTFLSAKSNDPLNLAINAPTGEGKTYVVQKVADLFPKNDVISLVGMSEKALFHRSGPLVVKDDDGNYISVKKKANDIDAQISACKAEIERTTNNDLKQAKRHEIKDLEEQRKEVYANSKKLIELSGKTLVFLDSPPAKLLEALMPLLSHDRPEVEYEFVDTYNGIKTRGNILRGFPAVIFTAAKDYTNNARYPEIQRRFLITNPEMSQEKYRNAIECISAKYSLPDYAYQLTVVSDQEKEIAKNIIINIQNRIIDICSSSLKRNHNQVFIPFREPLKASLPFTDASYMSAAKTLFRWIGLLATVHQRPLIRAMNDIYVQLIPLATFDDLIEAMSLIDHNNGVRPYILQWFDDVFIPAYESKNEPDTKERGGILLSENRCAVTTRELIEKTAEIQNRRLSPKQILETYLNPLINLNVISSEPSIIDRRFNIYYSVKQRTENKNLFDFARSNNISQLFQIGVKESTLFPDQSYIIHEIERVLNYSSDSRDKLVDHNGIERSVQEIACSYYSNFADCFKSGNIRERETMSHNSIGYDYLVVDHISKEYHYTHQNNIKSQTNCSIHEKNLPVKAERSIKLFVSSISNNFLYPDEENSGRTGPIEGSTSMEVHGTNSQMPEINSNSQLRKAVSTTHSPITNSPYTSQPNIESINQFFYDKPYMPYQPPPHELGDTPCRLIIKFDKHSLLYNCIMHPDFQSYHLESIEHHIKFKNPEMHKSEILKLLNMYQPPTNEL